MSLTHCKNQAFFSRLHMRNVCIQWSILSNSYSDMISILFLGPIGNFYLTKFLAHTRVWQLKCSANIFEHSITRL